MASQLTHTPLEVVTQTTVEQKPKVGKKPATKKSKFQAVVEHIDGLNDQQFRQSLMAAGIIDAAGQLAKKYVLKKKKK